MGCVASHLPMWVQVEALREGGKRKHRRGWRAILQSRDQSFVLGALHTQRHQRRCAFRVKTSRAQSHCTIRGVDRLSKRSAQPSYKEKAPAGRLD
jgi:hypothetical protein